MFRLLLLTIPVALLTGPLYPRGVTHATPAVATVEAPAPPVEPCRRAVEKTARPVRHISLNDQWTVGRA